jgi:hypothetical protein
MATPQRERSQYNPLNLGTFYQTSLRLLIGDLGPKSKIIQGGYGEDTYNHWFKVSLAAPAWIILIKAGSKLSTENIRPDQGTPYNKSRFDFSVYDLNKTPIQGRVILEEPREFAGQVAGAQSDLYNFSNYDRADLGNDMFYKLEPGHYLICISAVRHELMTYGVGMVIEFQTPNNELFVLCEDTIQSFLLQESAQSADIGLVYDEIISPITSDKLVETRNAATANQALIQSGVVVQVNYENSDSETLTWYIGPPFPNVDPEDDRVLLDATDNWVDTVRERSLSEWKTAWERENMGSFPFRVFTPYVTTQ